MSSSPPPPPPPPPSATDPPPPPHPPRKFPAPCWTQEEALALISAYKDKWYSLRRRNLRIADWESVASDVNRRCPNQSPPKTSAQCRHKMEKLRKRYRTEKQRLLHLPHHPARLFSPPSSWAFFDLMNSMESGSDPQSQNPQIPNGVLLKSVETKPDLKPRDELGKYFDEILLGMNGGGPGGGPIKIRVKNNHNNHHDLRQFDADDEYYGGNVRLDSSTSKRRRTGRDSVSEMVASIKMLGEGMVRMEKMKMDMMREMERTRMEMEMKRSEMIFESQQLIVNAFVEGLKKNKKGKVLEQVE